MTYEHAMELLGNVVSHVCVAENTATQIDMLQRDFGFTNEDLLEFEYSEEDVKNYGE